jgi:hypothetical protein
MLGVSSACLWRAESVPAVCQCRGATVTLVRTHGGTQCPRYWAYAALIATADFIGCRTGWRSGTKRPAKA